MSLELLNKTRRLNETLQNEIAEQVVLNKICESLQDIIVSNVLLMASNGKVLSCKLVSECDDVIKFEYDEHGAAFVEGRLCSQLMNVTKSQENLSMQHMGVRDVSKEKLGEMTATIIPLKAMSKKVGVMLLYRSTGNYDIEDIIIGENAAILASIKIISVQEEQMAGEQRKIENVKSAISTLSYSELEAILYIFDELSGKEGLLVASKIADRVGITRSIIVNAIRKLESAGVIESRSLGMKGTFIKVVNDALLLELEKLQK